MGYWDDVYEDVEKSGGTGGVIAKGWVDFGFFVYAQGFTGNDNAKKFFSSRKLGSRSEAQKAAKKFAAENGADPKLNPVIQECAFLEGAVKVDGNPVGWNCDQFETIPTWTIKKGSRAAAQPSMAKSMMEVLERLNIEPGKEYWFQFSWMPDPYKESLGEEGKTEQYTYTDETGDEVTGMRVPLLMYPVAAFESKEAALATVSSDATPALSFVPEGWDAEDWAPCVTDIKEQKEMHGLNNAQVKEYVQETYEVEISMGELIKILK